MIVPTNGGRRCFLDLFRQCLQLSGAVTQLFCDLSLHLRCNGNKKKPAQGGEIGVVHFVRILPRSPYHKILHNACIGRLRFNGDLCCSGRDCDFLVHTSWFRLINFRFEQCKRHEKCCLYCCCCWLVLVVQSLQSPSHLVLELAHADLEVRHHLHTSKIGRDATKNEADGIEKGEGTSMPRKLTTFKKAGCLVLPQ